MVELIVMMDGYDMGKISENSCKELLYSYFELVIELILGNKFECFGIFRCFREVECCELGLLSMEW